MNRRLGVSALLVAAVLLGPTPSDGRWMNPNTGRFWTMDSYEGDQYRPASLHKYLYASADAVNRVDPSGHADFNLVSLLSAAFVGGVIAAISTPYTANAPGPNDPAYPAVSAEEILGNFTFGFVTVGAAGGVSQGARAGANRFVARRLAAQQEVVSVRIVEGAGYESVSVGGRVYTGGYDPRTKTVYLGDNGHANGVFAAGGTPTEGVVSGITVIEREGLVHWGDTSVSLRSVLSAQEIDKVTEALQKAFPEEVVVHSRSVQ